MSTEATRQYNWVTDKNNGIAITASRMDTEFDNIITKLNQKVLIKSSAPSGPIEGMLWYDSTNKVLKAYRNSTWVEVIDAVNTQTIAGVKTFSDEPVLSSGVKTDTISEDTADTGVTVDGCLIKDGKAADSNKVGGYAYNETEIKPFGAWDTKAVNTVYQAATDGFVTAYGTHAANGAGYILVKTDGNNPPTTIRNKNGNGNTSYSSVVGIMCPVRKGHYYEVQVDGTYVASATIYWIPLGV